MNAQLKFSDIIRFVLLGGVALLYFVLLLNMYDPAVFDVHPSEIKGLSGKVIRAFGGHYFDTFTLVIILVVSLFAGIIIQSVRAYIEELLIKALRFLTRNSSGRKGIERKGYSFLSKMVEILIYGSVYHACLWVKLCGIHKPDIPDWLYLTDKPNRTLDYVSGRLAKNVMNEDMNSLNESFYYNEFFMGLSFVIIFVPVIVLIVSAHALDLSDWIVLLFVGLLLVDIGCFHSVKSRARSIKNIWAEVGFLLAAALMWVLLAGSVEMLTPTTAMLASTFAAVVAVRKIANMFAMKYLKSINTHYNALEDYYANGQRYIVDRIPFIYVLIRTHYYKERLDFITESINTVLDQTYPNKRIIIFDDCPKGGAPESDGLDLIQQIEQNLFAKHGPKPDHIDDLKKICIYKKASRHFGPSGSSIEIREAFLTEASERDIALLLDDDDYLDRKDALMDIAVVMNATHADICLTTFRNLNDMGSVLSNAGGKFHNEQVKFIAGKRVGVEYDRNLIFTDTLGWTKVYSYATMERYLGYIKAYNEEIADRVKADSTHSRPDDCLIDRRFNEIEAFEDFPDFILYLFEDTRIAGIERPIHCYRKRKDSATDLNGKKYADVAAAFLQRKQFLAYTLGLASFITRYQQSPAARHLKAWRSYRELREDAIPETKEFISYKLAVICNIILTRSFDNGERDMATRLLTEFLHYNLIRESECAHPEAHTQTIALRNLITDTDCRIEDTIRRFLSDGVLSIDNRNLRIIEAHIKDFTEEAR